MIVIQNVIGTQEIVPKIEIVGEIVFIRNNIIRTTFDTGNGNTNECWQYDEIQYDLREYLQLTSSKVETLEKDKAELQNQVTQNQVAMAELLETVATLQGAKNA